MDLRQYINDATRTESNIDNVSVNRKFLQNALTLFIASGEFLDMIKKNVYYGKPIDQIKFKNMWHSALESLRQLEFIPLDEQEQQFVKENIPVNPRVFHAIIGIATEAAEIVEAIDISKTGIDDVNLLEEFGDLNWYEAIGIDALNGDFEQVLETNINKLKNRFPEAFTSQDAINRNTDNEREVLENGFKKD